MKEIWEILEFIQGEGENFTTKNWGFYSRRELAKDGIDQIHRKWPEKILSVRSVNLIDNDYWMIEETAKNR